MVKLWRIYRVKRDILTINRVLNVLECCKIILIDELVCYSERYPSANLFQLFQRNFCRFNFQFSGLIISRAKIFRLIRHRVGRIAISDHVTHETRLFGIPTAPGIGGASITLLIFTVR